MRVILLFTAMLGFLLCLGDGRGSLAQDGRPALTGGQIKGFISSYPAAKQLAERYGLDERETAYAGPAASRNEVFAGVIGEMKAAGAFDEFEALVRQHGFAGAEDWVGTANRIMIAYAVMSAEDSQGGGRVDENMDRQLADARKQVEAADMPADQKQQALRQLDAMAGQMKMLDIPEADRTVIRPFMTELDGIVDTE